MSFSSPSSYRRPLGGAAVNRFRARYSDVARAVDEELSKGGAEEFDLRYWGTATMIWAQRRRIFRTSEKEMPEAERIYTETTKDFFDAGLALEYLELLGRGKTPARRFDEALTNALPVVAVPDLRELLAEKLPKVREQDQTPVMYNPEIESAIGGTLGSFAPAATTIAKLFSVSTIGESATTSPELEKAKEDRVSDEELRRISEFLNEHESLSRYYGKKVATREESERLYKEFWGHDADIFYYEVSGYGWQDRRKIGHAVSFCFGNGAAPGPKVVWKDGFFHSQFETNKPAVHARIYTCPKSEKAFELASAIVDWARKQDRLPNFSAAFQDNGDSRCPYFGRFTLDVPFGELPKIISFLQNNSSMLHPIQNAYPVGVQIAPGASAVIEGPCQDHTDFNSNFGEAVAFTEPTTKDRFTYRVIKKLLDNPATRDHTLFMLGRYQFELR